MKSQTEKVKTQRIKELRKLTGHSLSDCSKALIEMDWDMKEAHEYLKSMSTGFGKYSYLFRKKGVN